MDVAAPIRNALAHALKALGVDMSAAQVPLEFPAELSHGDYASGVALAKAKEANMPPRALAEKIVEGLGVIDGVAKIEIAGPGFINFTLAPEVFARIMQDAASKMCGTSTMLAGKRIMVEYTQPNPFKPFHIGHLMSNTIGESVSRLVQNAGADVVRANYQGDVGPHVAKCLWGVQKLGVDPTSADELGRAYAYGASAYEDDPAAKQEIDAINKKIYKKSDPELNRLYDIGCKASLEHFEKLYAMLGTKFDHYFFESETAPKGERIVKAHPDVFVESDGARVFKGEAYGLHTRVFLTSQGLPTYEAKEIGLEFLKQELYPNSDAFLITTAVEQKEYFAVISKVLSLLDAGLAQKLAHISHGMMRFASGKMSSRRGNVVTGESLLQSLVALAREHAKNSRADDTEILAQQVAVAAIKYQILKANMGKDIVFDEARALSLEGDSGPYLQYAHARCCAILEKAAAQGIAYKSDVREPNDVARLLLRFPAVAERAAREYAPHHVAQYLLDLAGAFNSWYAREQILDGTDDAPRKVALVAAVGQTLKSGLFLLGIPAPEKM